MRSFRVENTAEYHVKAIFSQLPESHVTSRKPIETLGCSRPESERYGTLKPQPWFPCAYMRADACRLRIVKGPPTRRDILDPAEQDASLPTRPSIADNYTLTHPASVLWLVSVRNIFLVKTKMRILWASNVSSRVAVTTQVDWTGLVGVSSEMSSQFSARLRVGS